MCKFNADLLFADINLEGCIVQVKKNSTGLFKAESLVEIKAINNSSTNIYNAQLLPKAMKTYNDVIAINLGTEADFIHTNGWLIKKYISSQEVRKIVLADDFAGIVYRDKIEIIEL